MRRDLEPVLAIAGRQNGVVSRAQAKRWISTSSLTWLLSSGRCQRIHPGVFAVHRGPLTWPMRAVAALLHAGRGAALSGPSAGYVHGFVKRPPPVIDVVIPHDRRVRRVPGMRLLDHAVRARLCRTVAAT